VVVYVAVPSVISSGTFIERRRVEFVPGVGGSGEKDIDLMVKRDNPLLQSERVAEARLAREAIARNKRDSILHREAKNVYAAFYDLNYYTTGIL
jgi:hypothetical protein